MDFSEATFPYHTNIESKALVKEINIPVEEFPDNLSNDKYGYSTELFIAV